jgi:hypothetical protein
MSKVPSVKMVYFLSDSSKMWFWRRMEKVSCTDPVENDEGMPYIR